VAGRAKGEHPSFDEIVATKYQDSASGDLFKASVEGKADPASIAFLKIIGPGYWRERLRLGLEGVLIAG
jgi:hypothetical protein